MTGRAGEGEERTFRYAPLSSGLDIVRKTLGQHEIATMQTTAIDQAAGLVNLTTMLAHASGEWIASDWPVCPIADMASPRRMGAALTYARRYALFTLVGIAGEDDLDAPDLQDRVSARSPSAANGAGNGSAAPSVHQEKTPSTNAASGYAGRRGRRLATPAPVILAGEQSAELRDRLLGQIAAIATADQGAAWARTAIPAKNTLAVADAAAIEQAFERRLIDLAAVGEPEVESGWVPGQGDGGLQPDAGAVTSVGDRTQPEQLEARAGPSPAACIVEATAATDESSSRIDKSVLALSEPKRHRNREHLRFVSQQACLVCGRTPSDPHHLRFAQQRALGRKVSDEFVVPLCRTHHRALHRVGNEPGWWKATGIDPLDVARKLWGQTRLIEQPEPVAVQAALEPLRVDVDPRPGNAPPSQAARRDRRRSSKSSARGPANGRMP